MVADHVAVDVVEAVDDELVAAWERLLPQLSGSASRVTATVLQEIVQSSEASLLAPASMG